MTKPPRDESRSALSDGRTWLQSIRTELDDRLRARQIAAYADAMADMFCAYLARLSRR
jgi:hypothetical protein